MSNLLRLPDEIERASEEGRLIVFLGAGISCAVGLPDWNSVKNNLINELRPLKEDNPNIKRELGKMDFYDCFGSIFIRDKTMYERTLGGALMSRAANLPKFKQLLSSLRSLKPVSFATTNVDDLLQDCGSFTVNQFRYMHDCMPQELDRDKVFCLHGNRSKNVFNGFERRNLYAQPDFHNLLGSMFGSYNVLFVGFSFRDAKLLEPAEISLELAKTGSTRHAALVPSNQESPPPTLLKDKYGIRVLEYDNADDNHQHFGDTILSWEKRDATQTADPSRSPL